MSETYMNIVAGKNGSKGWALVKQRLIGRRRELLERVDAIDKDLERVGNPVSADWNERAAQRANDEVLAAIGGANEREVAAIDAALRRLETVDLWLVYPVRRAHPCGTPAGSSAC